MSNDGASSPFDKVLPFLQMVYGRLPLRERDGRFGLSVNFVNATRPGFFFHLQILSKASS